MNQRSTDAHERGSSFADARRSSRFRGVRGRNAILDYSAAYIRPRGKAESGRTTAGREAKSKEDSVRVTVSREKNFIGGTLSLCIFMSLLAAAFRNSYTSTMLGRVCRKRLREKTPISRESRARARGVHTGTRGSSTCTEPKRSHFGLKLPAAFAILRGSAAAFSSRHAAVPRA